MRFMVARSCLSASAYGCHIATGGGHALHYGKSSPLLPCVILSPGCHIYGQISDVLHRVMRSPVEIAKMSRTYLLTIKRPIHHTSKRKPPKFIAQPEGQRLQHFTPPACKPSVHGWSHRMLSRILIRYQPLVAIILSTSARRMRSSCSALRA